MKDQGLRDLGAKKPLQWHKSKKTWKFDFHAQPIQDWPFCNPESHQNRWNHHYALAVAAFNHLSAHHPKQKTTRGWRHFNRKSIRGSLGRCIVENSRTNIICMRARVSHQLAESSLVKCCRKYKTQTFLFSAFPLSSIFTTIWMKNPHSTASIINLPRPGTSYCLFSFVSSPFNRNAWNQLTTTHFLTAQLFFALTYVELLFLR